MTKTLDLLGTYFAVYDDAPPSTPSLAWTADFPPTYQDPDRVLLIQGVSLIVSMSTAVANRRISLSFRMSGDREYARVTSTIVLTTGQTRGVDFGGGQPASLATLPGALARETLPDNMVLQPGHRLVVEIDNRQAGDVVTAAAVRGRILPA